MEESASEKQIGAHLESIDQNGAAKIVHIEANPSCETPMEVDQDVKVAPDGHVSPPFSSQSSEDCYNNARIESSCGLC